MRAAIEEEQPGHLAGMVERQPLHDVGADIVADEARTVDAKRVQQSCDVVGEDVRPRLVRPTGRRIAAFAEAAEVGRDQPVAVGQTLEHRLPRRPEFGPAVQQDQRRAIAALCEVGGETACLDEGVFEGWHGYSTCKFAGGDRDRSHSI